MENQHVAGGDTPHPKGTEHRLHHAMRCGNQMFAGCWMSGVGIIDVSDITKPKTLSRYEYNPPHPEPTHTFLGVPHSDRRQAHRGLHRRGARQPRPRHGKPHAPLRTWDVTDPTKPKLLCTYELPESATPYDTNVVRFGTHQLREKVDTDNLLYVTWFAGGLRIMDINDPANPKERGYFIPKPGDGANAPLDQRRLQGRPRLAVRHRQEARPRRDRVQGLSLMSELAALAAHAVDSIRNLSEEGSPLAGTSVQPASPIAPACELLLFAGAAASARRRRISSTPARP